MRIGLLRVLSATLGLVCLAIPFRSFQLGRADRLRHHPSPAAVIEAIHLDPGNSYAYTLQAELLEQHQLPVQAELQWTEALRRSARNAEAWIRLAALTEQRGSPAEAEASLRQAAAMSATWFPRWALASFYLRHHRIDEFRVWSHKAMLRASDDVVALFPLFDEAGLSPDVLIDEVLPRNRRVLTAWLSYRIEHKQNDGLYRGAATLAAQIPTGARSWPGLEAMQHAPDDSERKALLAATDRLRDTGQHQSSVRLWNLLCSRRIIASDPWSEAAPSINAQFRYPIQGAGFDWRIPAVQGIRIVAGAPAQSLEVQLNGSQPERISQLIYQPVYLPARHACQLVVESRSSDLSQASGLRWEIRDVETALGSLTLASSPQWTRQTIPLPASDRDRALEIHLAYARLPGTVRAEGSVEFRRVALELVP